MKAQEDQKTKNKGMSSAGGAKACLKGALVHLPSLV